MKRIFIALAAAAMTFAGCTKVEMGTNAEINFQLASYATKSTSYANGPFGVSAWYKGETAAENVDYFMDNQEVTGTDGSAEVWKPTKTYYWPKSGYLNFIAYSPYKSENAPELKEDAISFSNVTVGNEDLMYSDKSNYNTAETSQNGVPILFHHAFARVKMMVEPSYNKIWDSTTGTYTYWEITIDSDITIPSVYTIGSLTLNLNSDGTTWAKPENSIWTPVSTANGTIVIPAPGDITDPDYTPTAVDAGAYVLPQVAAGSHFHFTCTVKTYRGTGATEDEAKANATLVLTETKVPVSGTIPTNTDNTALNYWSMNTVTTYNVKIAPAYEGVVKTPVYIADEDNDGTPDVNPDGTYKTTTDPDKAYKDPDTKEPVPNVTPVYIQDKDGDGQPDLNPDGTPKTTIDPDDALVDPTTGKPVYVKDENNDGVPDTDDDGNIETTTDPKDALETPDYVETKTGQPVMITFDPAVTPWEEINVYPANV